MTRAAPTIPSSSCALRPARLRPACPQRSARSARPDARAGTRKGGAGRRSRPSTWSTPRSWSSPVSSPSPSPAISSRILALERQEPLGAAVEPQPRLGRLDPPAGTARAAVPPSRFSSARTCSETAGWSGRRAARPPARSCAARRRHRTRLPAVACPGDGTRMLCETKRDKSEPGPVRGHDQWVGGRGIGLSCPDARLDRHHELAARGVLPAAAPAAPGGDGHEVEVTAREFAQTLELLELNGIEHRVVGPGAHGGGGASSARRGRWPAPAAGAAPLREGPPLRSRARAWIARSDARGPQPPHPGCDSARLRVRDSQHQLGLRAASRVVFLTRCPAEAPRAARRLPAEARPVPGPRRSTTSPTSSLTRPSWTGSTRRRCSRSCARRRRLALPPPPRTRLRAGARSARPRRGHARRRAPTDGRAAPGDLEASSCPRWRFSTMPSRTHRARCARGPRRLGGEEL